MIDLNVLQFQFIRRLTLYRLAVDAPLEGRHRDSRHGDAERRGLVRERAPFRVSQVVQKRDELASSEPLAAAKLERSRVNPGLSLALFPLELRVDERGEFQCVVDENNGRGEKKGRGGAQ